MDYKIFSSNRSILQSSAIHPIIATADKSGHFVPVGATSAFIWTYGNNGFAKHPWKSSSGQQHAESECLQVQWLLVRQVVVLSSNCLEMSNISNKWSSQTRRQENPKVIATDGYPPLLSVVQSNSKNAQLNMQF